MKMSINHSQFRFNCARLPSVLTVAVVRVLENRLLSGDDAEVDVGNVVAQLGHTSTAGIGWLASAHAE